MSAALAPRKLIWVAGLALSASGSGETSMSVPARRATCSSVFGRHDGETLLAARLTLEPEMPREREPVAVAATIHASTATSRTMYRVCIWIEGPEPGAPR